LHENQIFLADIASRIIHSLLPASRPNPRDTDFVRALSAAAQSKSTGPASTARATTPEGPFARKEKGIGQIWSRRRFSRRARTGRKEQSIEPAIHTPSDARAETFDRAFSIPNSICHNGSRTGCHQGSFNTCAVHSGSNSTDIGIGNAAIQSGPTGRQRFIAFPAGSRLVISRGPAGIDRVDLRCGNASEKAAGRKIDAVRGA
jgi:hypothetical protein